MKLAILFGSCHRCWTGRARAAGRLRAQDLRGEIEAIVRDYLANHPDEVGAIAKDYFVKHPEAVGQILQNCSSIVPRRT